MHRGQQQKVATRRKTGRVELRSKIMKTHFVKSGESKTICNKADDGLNIKRDDEMKHVDCKSCRNKLGLPPKFDAKRAAGAYSRINWS
jgi:hypothetical protein